MEGAFRTGGGADFLALWTMRNGSQRGTMSTMNRPLSKIMLIADPRDAGRDGGAVQVRRFHLARLRQEDSAAITAPRALASAPAPRR